MITSSSRYAFFRQYAPDAASSGGGIDNEHPDDRPVRIKIGRLACAYWHIGYASYELSCLFRDDNFRSIRQRAHPRNARRHGRPIVVLVLELGERRKRDPV